MNVGQFTPGPWIAKELPYGIGFGSYEIQFGNDGELVAEKVYIESDANLIAAAPDMYEALKLTYELLSVGQPLGNEDLDKIHSTLNKANGK